MNEPNLVDHREHGALTEADLMPTIKSDPAALFASDENVSNFLHFYERGRDETVNVIRNRIQVAIATARIVKESNERDAYINGLKKALTML